MKKPISYAPLSALFFIAISLSSDNAASSEEKYKPVMKHGTEHYGDGYVEYREGIPFIYLKGDSYETGLQYGVLLRDEMKRLYADLDSFEHAMMHKVYEESPWYMDIIIKISTPLVMRSKLISFKQRVPDDYLKQLEGMSEGSGISMDDLLIVTFGSDWLSCSSFIKKVDGRIIHGRNADHDVIDFFSKYPVVVHYNKEGKYSYIDIGIVGTPFAVTGINEHGLTLSWSQATSSDSKSFDGTGTTLMFNRILEECRDLNDVDKASKNVDRFVVMIGSLEDRAGAAYDIVDKTAVRTDLKDDYIYATNRCVSPLMREEYNSVFDMDWGNSARAFTYEKVLSKSDDFTIDDAIDLLANTDFYDYSGKLPPFEGGNINNRGTGSSVVMDPANCTVYFAYGAPYAAFSRWIAYDYDADEVEVYRDEDERLHDSEVIEYVEMEKRWKDVDWDDEDGLRQMLDEMERVSAENIWTLHTSCWAWNALGDTEKTEAIINRQIDRYPDYQTVFTNMGFLRMKQGRVGEAVQYYTKALNAPITNDRKRLYCHEQLAAAYAEIGDEARSADHYRKGLDLYNKYYIPKRSREHVSKIEKLLKDKTNSGPNRHHD